MSASDDPLSETRAARYHAYERVFRALSEKAAEDRGHPSSDLSYRQHVAIETLRDVELTRQRHLLLARAKS